MVSQEADSEMETIVLDFIKESVLVSSGCYKKYHRRGGLNNKPLFLTALEAEKSKTKVPADLVLGESPIPGFQMVSISLYSHDLFVCMQRESSGLSSSSYNDTNTIMGLHS